MAFSKQQLHKFANLIRIEISDEKLEKMNIDGVVEWLDKLQKIDMNKKKYRKNGTKNISTSFY